MRRFLRILLRVVLVLLALTAALVFWQWDNFQRLFMGGLKVYETTPPALPAEIKRPAILVFSKTNGFRHAESIDAANKLYANLAVKNGWGYYQTENGATFSPALLARFDAVVFNNVSGDVFTPEQRAAFKSWLEQGGGFVGVHGSGGDFSYAWKWYVNDLIGTQFIGHPMNPQFQKATIVVEDKTHPATAQLPATWSRTDEWYSFEKPARGPGQNVLMTLDETSYSPKGMFGQDLAMGKDHPIAWWHCVGKGRALYSALGHLPEAYAESAHQTMLEGSIRWSLKLEGDACGVSPLAGREKL